MAIIASPLAAIAVDTSKSLEVQALAINAAANQLRTTIAGVWDLGQTSAQPPPPESTLVLKRVLPGQESVLDGDERTLVDPQHYAPGGKYRGIIKLLIKYQQKPNGMAHGTGWLIKPDLIATAGHNVYDWSHNAGRAVEIKCYAGWEGTANIDPSKVEFRNAARVVTTERWLQTRGSKPYDFALIRVDKPFTNVTPFQYIETPPFQANARLGIVGYPAETRDQNGERGAKMYEMFLDTEYNLEKQADTMIEYSIDTEGGQSGSPVLLENGLVAIGAHVYRGSLNAASALGRYGNPIQDYIAAVDLKLPQPNQINLLSIADDVVAARTAATGKQSTAVLTKLEGGEHVATASSSAKKAQLQEGMFDSFADVLRTSARFVSVVGAPLGLNIAQSAQMAILAAQASALKAESSFEYELKQARGNSTAHEKRALLARANLQLAAKQVATGSSEGFLELFEKVGTVVGGAINPIAPIFVPGLPFLQVVGAFGIPAQAAQLAVNEVAITVTQALLLAQRVPFATASSAENAMDENVAAKWGPFLAALKEAKVKEQQSTTREEGFVDDILVAQILNGISRGGAESSFAETQPRRTGPTKAVGSRGGNGESIFDDIGDAFGVVRDVADSALHTSVSDAFSRVNGAMHDAWPQEGFFDDLGDAFSDIGNTFAEPFRNPDVLVEPFRDVGKTFIQPWRELGDSISGLGNNISSGFQAIAVGQEGFFDDVGDFVGAFPAVQITKWIVEEAGRAESAMDEGESESVKFTNNIVKISQAFMLRRLIEDEYLKATMIRPAEELKAEGFFDDLVDTVGKIGRIGVGTITRDPNPLFPGLAPNLIRELIDEGVIKYPQTDPGLVRSHQGTVQEPLGG